MNNYLVPQSIAEELGLTTIRKSTPDGTYVLLSEYDLVGYGLERALQEGAIVLSSPERVTNHSEASTTEVSTTENSGEETATDDSEGVTEETDEGDTGETEGDTEETETSEEQESNNNEEEDTV